MGLYAHLVRNVFHPLALWRAGELRQLQYLREFERTQFLPADELRARQLARLRALLDHAYRECPYYRGCFDRAGLVPSDVRSLDDLRALPVLEKQTIQEQRDRLVAQSWPRDDLIPNQTGGSTGAPLSFFLSRDRKSSRAAATQRHNRWAGWRLGDRVAVIWGAPRDVPPDSWRYRFRNALIDRQLFLDTAHLTEVKLAAYHEALQRFRPRIILAYARAALLFARYLKARGLQPYQPHAIVTSAEVLEPDERAILEEVFGCRVFNRYGCREVSVVASECEAHRGMHTMAEGLYVEVVRGDRPAATGEMGSILVTDLLNLAMPLIRYRIGDLGTWEEGACPCGRSLPRLRSVAGRVTDFIVGADGRLVSGVFLATYVVAQRPQLGQVQIRQDTAGTVLYRIRRGRDFRDAEELLYLKEASRRHLGDGTVVEWEFVDELAAEPSGKFLFSRSTVTPEFLASGER